MAAINLGSSRDLVLSDTPNDQFNMIMIMGTTGTVIYGQEGGNVTTITNARGGVWLPVGNATHVLTSSTATGIVVV
jgi:hypothetical protein